MKKILTAVPLALAAAAVLATPASAASPLNAGKIRAEIQQLDRQVDRMRGLSDREERRLESQVDRLDALYRSYARGGFTRSELQRLDSQVNAVKAQVYAQSRDRDGRFARNDRDGRHGDHGPRYDGHHGPDRHDRR